MSSPLEQIIVDALDRIERKCDRHAELMAQHVEQDRVTFQRIESEVDLLLTDHALRKRAAEDAGRAAGASAGKFWGIVGTVLAGLISGLGAVMGGGR